MEVLSAAGEDATKPPLVFVHGAGHGAWCWAERFMPYFSAAGYECHAVSLRGQGRSEPVDQPGTLALHAGDLSAFLSTLRAPPVMVGHSFGGLISMYYARESAKAGAGDAGGKYRPVRRGPDPHPHPHAAGPPPARLGRDGPAPHPPPPPRRGLALLGSAPPTGNAQMILRFLKRDVVESVLITYWFIARTWAKDPKVCRRMFFSEDLPEEDLMRYFGPLSEYLGRPNVVDVRTLSAEASEKKPIGRPPFPLDVFVLGGDGDKVVDEVGVRETAAYYGAEPVVVPGMAHDVMLDTKWETAAERMAAWLGGL